MSVVAYLGPEKTNTHFVAQKKFGTKAKYMPVPTVEDVFRMVERKKAEFGVAAIENSLQGAITHTLDRFIDFEKSPVKIYGEVDESIQHFLMMKKNVKPETIRTVFSHYSALDQCREWLHSNFPKASTLPTGSTASAINELSKKDASGFERAAIGRLELAKEHGLKVIPIPIDKENRTRFLILSLKKAPVGKKSKTSLMVALKDKPGALHDGLMPFKKNKINLTKIESRPSKKKAWEYLFFIDLEGHESDPRVKKALTALRKSVASVRVLGSYPLC